MHDVGGFACDNSCVVLLTILIENNTNNNNNINKNNAKMPAPIINYSSTQCDGVLKMLVLGKVSN